MIVNQGIYIQQTDVEYELSFGMKLFGLLVSKRMNYKLHRYMYQKLVNFYADEMCNGCGICEKVCLSKKTQMLVNKPVWKKDIDCYACFVCINYCPQEAHQIESKFPIQSNTDVNDRYHHKSVTYKDISQQRSNYA